MFILKLLTILFFLYYCAAIFTQHNLTKAYTVNCLNEVKEKILTRQNTKLENNDFLSSNFISLMIIGFSLMAMYLAEFIYILCVIQYDSNKYITIGYLVFWILMFIINKIQNKKQVQLTNMKDLSVEGAIKKIDESIIRASKTSIFHYIQKIIDASYFGYMLYILFIR